VTLLSAKLDFGVIHAGYFDGGEASIRAALPARRGTSRITALGMPQAAVLKSGRMRQRRAGRRQEHQHASAARADGAAISL
jgi:hypothetical protein